MIQYNSDGSIYLESDLDPKKSLQISKDISEFDQLEKIYNFFKDETQAAPPPQET